MKFDQFLFSKSTNNEFQDDSTNFEVKINYCQFCFLQDEEEDIRSRVASMFQNSSGNSDDEDTEDSDEEDSMETGNSTPRVARKRKQVCYCHLTSVCEHILYKSCLVSKVCPETGR